jgi:3-deoxy-D-manno-octulosonic-acid transferase
MIGLYEVLWHLLLPVLLLFLWRRGEKEPLYRRFWSERWGNTRTRLERPLWVHSASMGEIVAPRRWYAPAGSGFR